MKFKNGQGNGLRDDAIDASLKATLSEERLSTYLHDVDGRLHDALTLYERNVSLAESFYSPLQCMEVCFRNRLHRQMQATYGADWLTGNAAPLAPDAIDDISQAIKALRGRPFTVGTVVAELHFGFWVGLIGPRYDATLWRKGLHKAFRAQGGQKRSVVHGRFNALRRFRNRIAHHEPIFNRPVEQLHSEIIEAIGWMCRHTSAWAAHQSRFHDVFHGRTT